MPVASACVSDPTLWITIKAPFSGRYKGCERGTKRVLEAFYQGSRKPLNPKPPCTLNPKGARVSGFRGSSLEAYGSAKSPSSLEPKIGSRKKDASSHQRKMLKGLGFRV